MNHESCLMDLLWKLLKSIHLMLSMIPLKMFLKMSKETKGMLGHQIGLLRKLLSQSRMTLAALTFWCIL